MPHITPYRINFVALYCVAIAFAVPWQRVNWIQKGVTPFHFLNAIIVILALFPFLQRKKVRFYFLAPLFIYLLGTVLGMFNSKFIGYNVYTISQDLYLYVWFVLLSVVFTTDKNAKYLSIAWLCTSMFVVIWMAESSIFAGTDHSRLEFSFRNPNRAAAYFIVSAVLTCYPSIPWYVRVIATGILLQALLATGSAGGLLAFLAGACVLCVVWFYMKYVERLRLHAVMLIGLCGIILVGTIVLSGEGLREGYSEATGQAGARVDRSANVRQMIWRHGVETFEEHPLGIGPGSFFQQFPTQFGQDEKNVELHSDWFGTLVERGLVGILGLIAFVIAIGFKAGKLIALGVHEVDERYKLWIAALVGGTVSYIAMSFTHETLHHETFWLLLALMMGSLGRPNQLGAIHVEAQELEHARSAVFYRPHPASWRR